MTFKIAFSPEIYLFSKKPLDVFNIFIFIFYPLFRLRFIIFGEFLEKGSEILQRLIGTLVFLTHNFYAIISDYDLCFLYRV